MSLKWPQAWHWRQAKRRPQLSRNGHCAKLAAKNSQTHVETLVPMLSEAERCVGGGIKSQELPAFDKANGTRRFCLCGLICSWLVSIACIVLARWTFRSGQLFRTHAGSYTHNGQGERVFFLSTTRQEMVKLAVNVCIGLCTDCTGYIHSVSSRWALWREGQLSYNSNTRLLISTRRCSSSRWSTNLVSAFLLMICYASSGQLFLSSSNAEQKGFVLNGVAVSALGVGIFGQAGISTLCMWNSKKLIPTWSSNPLNTALTCRHLGLHRIESRCLRGLYEIREPSTPSKPLLHQYSAHRSRTSVRYIVRLCWTSTIVTVVWGIAVRASPGVRRLSSTTLPLYGVSVPVLELNLCAILITTALQVFLTLSFHLTEMVVNISRDEHVWRLATSRQGTRTSDGPLGSLKSALISWQTMILFILKSVTYWLFSLAVNADGQLVYMNWEGIFLLLVGVVVTAAFCSWMAWTQSNGPQPAAYGHLQTLVDLVDEWCGPGQSLRWGDKGIAEGRGHNANQNPVRHAGTAKVNLESIKMRCFYS